MSDNRKLRDHPKMTSLCYRLWRLLLRLQLFACITIYCSAIAEYVSDELSGHESSHEPHGNSNRTYAGTFLIVAPRVIRPGLPFAASVQLLRGPGAAVVNIKIRDSNNFTVAQAYAKDVHEGKPVTARIDVIPDQLIEEESYKLYAKAESFSGKTLFEAEEPIRFDRKSLSIFIQSDRAIYKPGATVQFRVVVVDPGLLPFSGSVDLKVTDPRNNVIMQKLGEPLEMGVVSQNLTLSSEPPLGEWTISVVLDNQQKATKTFSVDKYVLPTFEVNIVPPPVATIKDDISVLVKATYTYGKGVAGKVTLRTEYAWAYDWNANDYKPLELTTNLNENGETVFRLPITTLLKNNLVSPTSFNSLKLTATVTETLTGIQRNSTTRLIVHRSAMRINIEKQADSFKPGLPFSFNVAVLNQQDDTPFLAAVGGSISAVLTFYFPSHNDTTLPSLDKPPTKLVLNSAASAKLVFETPDDANSLLLELTYKSNTSDGTTPEALSESIQVFAAHSPSNSFIQLAAEKGVEIWSPGGVVSFNLTSTEPLHVVTLQVLTRGVVLLSRQVELQDGVRSTNMDFLATNEMAPRSRLIVYAIRPQNKEVLVDALDFNVMGLFRNTVNVTIEPVKAQPHQTVEIRVKAEPGSFVGLCSVDQSSLLLKSGNDITEKMVEEELMEYDTTGGFGGGGGYFKPWEPSAPVEDRRRRRRKRRSSWNRFWPSGGKDSHSVFENAGVVVLTDAFVYRERLLPIFYRAGPYAFTDYARSDATNTDQTSAIPISVRRHFPETWFFTDIIMADSQAEMVLKTTVPDSITSWVTTAFAVSPTAGFGVVSQPTKLQVYRPFFIRLNLPYLLKRGEKFALQVLIFNYLDTEQAVTVVLDQTGKTGFQFVGKPVPEKPAKDKSAAANGEEQNVRKIIVAGNGGSASVYFPIVATTVGDLKLLVRAFAQSATDAVEQNIPVSAEGSTVYFNHPLVVDPRPDHQFRSMVHLERPGSAGIVPGSESVEFSAIGDIMGPVLENVDELIRMPHGCGEQNMLNLVPNIVIARYLNSTKRLTTARLQKLELFMRTGYQRQLNFKRSDGSFSAFGESDRHGSTWLTAFVVRSLKQAQQFIFVDDTVLEKSLQFLRRQQKENGEFQENGEVHYKAMQGGSSEEGVALTAYVLIAFLVNGRRNDEALNFLEQRLQSIEEDSYALALTTYALHLAKSSKKDAALELLEEVSQTSEVMKFWSKSIKKSEPQKESSNSSWQMPPRPVDVEMTSYVLLTYVLRDEPQLGVPIIRWLTSQRNSLGGFASTQDTVVGIQSMGAYAEEAYVSDVNVELIIRQNDQIYNLQIDHKNANVLQQLKLHSVSHPVEITANGNGLAFAQVSWKYNIVEQPDEKPGFNCKLNDDKTLSPTIGSSQMSIGVCCRYAADGGRSNMAVFEIDAPSGYGFNVDKMNSLKTAIKDLQRVELAKSDTKAVLYLNSIGQEDTCLNFSASRLFPVVEQKPSHIRIVDYYEPTEMVELVYNAHSTTSLQELCLDCWPEPDHRSVFPSPNSAASSFRRCPFSFISLYILPLLLGTFVLCSTGL